MKQSTTYQKLTTLAVMASLVMAPLSVMAEDDDSEQDKPEPSATFCEMVKDKTVEDFKNFQMMEKMDDNRQERSDFLSALREKIDTRKSDHREERNEKFDALVQKWEVSAKTSSEREALAEFKTSLHDEIMDRQNEVASVVAAAREDRMALSKEAQEARDAAIAQLQEDVAAALEKAQTDCDNNVSSATVRLQFAADIKAALAKFRDSQKETRMEIKDEAKTMMQENKEARVEARSSFKSFFQSIRETWKSLFGKKTSDDGQDDDSGSDNDSDDDSNNDQ